MPLSGPQVHYGYHTELVPFSPEQAIDAAIAADEEGFMDVLEVFAHRYSAQARLDHQIFVDLFQNGCIPGLAVDGEA